MSRKSLLRLFASIGLAALTAGMIAGVGACSEDGGGTSVSGVCKDMCKADEECWGENYDDDEMDDCVDNCKDEWENDNDDDCFDEYLDSAACFYNELLQNDCDEGEADDNCENEYEKADDCEGDFSEGSPDSDSDADV
jgi:hypothetical protein